MFTLYSIAEYTISPNGRETMQWVEYYMVDPGELAPATVSFQGEDKWSAETRAERLAEIDARDFLNAWAIALKSIPGNYSLEEVYNRRRPHCFDPGSHGVFSIQAKEVMG